MPRDPRDHKRSFENVVPLQNDPTTAFLEEWIRLRESQGWTREAAITEINGAAGALLGPLSGFGSSQTARLVLKLKYPRRIKSGCFAWSFSYD